MLSGCPDCGTATALDLAVTQCDGYRKELYAMRSLLELERIVAANETRRADRNGFWAIVGWSLVVGLMAAIFIPYMVLQ